MNLLSIDTEFSSFYSPDRKKSGELLQVGIYPIVDGIPQEPFNEFCRPLTKIWSPHAEKVHKIRRRRAETFQHPMELAAKLNVYIKKFDRMFSAVGHNCKSDKMFIERLVADNKSSLDWHTSVRHKWIDTIEIAKRLKNQLGTKNLQLGTLAAYFGIKIEAHDAISDAKATFELYQMLDSFLAAKKGKQEALDSLSELDKRKKYLDMRYISMGGRGDVYLTEYCTANRDALRIALEEIWETYGKTL